VTSLNKSNVKIKQAFDEYIGDSKTVTQENKDRFYKWVESADQKKSKKLYILPKIATAIVCLMTILLVTNEIKIDQTQIENPKTSDETPRELTNERVPFEKVNKKLEEIKTDFRFYMTKVEAKQVFGVGIPSTDPESGAEVTEYHFLASNNKMEKIEVNKDSFLSGDIGIHLSIIWDKNKAKSAYIFFLNKDGELSDITYKSNGMVYEGGQFIHNALYPLDGSTLLVKSIAKSLNEEPTAIDESKLTQIKKLTIEHTNSGRFEELMSKDFEYIREMHNLEILHLKGIAVPIDTIIEIETLKTLTIEETSITAGNIGILAKMPNLDKLIIDKEKLQGWEELEEAGITVIDNNQ
jgi:hypothetical protein